MAQKIKIAAAVAVLTVIITSVIFWILPNLPIKTQLEIDSTKPAIIALWHVETFEGGLGSRSDWLKRRALAFEKKYKGIYIDVCKLTYQQLINRLSEGYSFDLISFGGGVGYHLLNYIIPYEGALNTLDALNKGGIINENQYAVPYMAGGYILAALKNNLTKISTFSSLTQNVFDCGMVKKIGKNTVTLASVACGFGQFNSPVTALAYNTAAKNKEGAAIFDNNVTQYGAYENFLNNNKATILLGTQRDYYRLANRVSNGKLSEVEYAALSGYNDLIQYISVGKTGDPIKTRYANLFVQYITSNEAQTTISGLFMLAAAKVNTYQDIIMTALQNNLEYVKTPSVFAANNIIEGLRTASEKCLFDGQKNLLKNYLC